MKLNPLKCVFGVPSGKLLGFIVSHRGIEVNPEKIKAILDIKRPTCLKDVQRLTGSAAAVRRFISRLGDKALPLYKLLKKSDKFEWTEEADKALTQLKETLTKAPILASPKEEEPMMYYLHQGNCVIIFRVQTKVSTLSKTGIWRILCIKEIMSLLRRTLNKQCGCNRPSRQIGH